MSKPTTNSLSNKEYQNEDNPTSYSKSITENEPSNHLVRNISNNMSPPLSSRPKTSMTSVDKKKMGHREVKDGVVHYKKVPTNELKKSIQFGVVHSVSFSNKYPDRDILIQDFTEVVTIQFPKAGTSSTPPHEYSDFKLKVYAPYGFKYLRRKCNLDEIDFMSSIGETELTEISNPGASGSVFYKTSNDKYILKTVQYQEAEFLKTLLAGFAFNLLQNLINNKYSLLPTIYGLYCYQKSELASRLTSDKTNIRVVIMNNILPSDIPIHEKYDLKGSLYKRKASRQERSKNTPTFKDLDFLEEHPDGIILDDRYYENIISSVKRDCLILQSFGIMDYSLLLGIHNLEKEKNNTAIEAYFDAKLSDPLPTKTETNSSGTNPVLTPIVKTANKLDKVFNITAVPARSAKGDRLLLYLGIIDILQSYKLKKKLEHAFKSLITDGKQISVCDPKFYENRFIEFLTQKVFKKNTLKSSPTRKRLTFKENKRGDEPSSPDQMNSIINRPNNSIKTPTIPLPSHLEIQKHTPVTFTNIKPIDSVDSMSGILGATDSRQSTNNASSLNRNVSVSKFANASKFEEIDESEGSSPNQNETRRAITPIIDHYTKNSPVNLNSNYTPSIKTYNYTNSNHRNHVNISQSNSKLSTTTSSYRSPNDNDYVNYIKPISVELHKPVTPTNWSNNSLLQNQHKLNTDYPDEVAEPSQNFNGWRRVSPGVNPNYYQKKSHNRHADEIEIITHL